MHSAHGLGLKEIPELVFEKFSKKYGFHGEFNVLLDGTINPATMRMIRLNKKRIDFAGALGLRIRPHGLCSFQVYEVVPVRKEKDKLYLTERKSVYVLSCSPDGFPDDLISRFPETSVSMKRPSAILIAEIFSEAIRLAQHNSIKLNHNK